MTTQPVENEAAPLRPTSFERFAGTCAVLADVAGFLYAVSFVVLQNVLLSGMFLMLGGLLSTAVLAAVYDRLRETDASFALWALLLIVPLARTISLDVRRTFLRCNRSLAEICWQGRRWTSISQTSPCMRQPLVRLLKGCANNVRRRCDNVGRRQCGDRPQNLRAVQRP